jgi:hypothetical protein
MNKMQQKNNVSSELCAGPYFDMENSIFQYFLLINPLLDTYLFSRLYTHPHPLEASNGENMTYIEPKHLFLFDMLFKK